MYAVPAADIDVAVIHAYASDIYGNIQIQPRHLLPQSMDIAISRACRKVIVTVEKIISTEEIKKTPHLTMIPSFRTTCVAHVPHGSHPTPVLSVNHTDDEFFAIYVEASSNRESFKVFLDKYVYGVNDYDGYLNLVGREHLKGLGEAEGL
jgi:glutaconate CoA-transferase subunit A